MPSQITSSTQDTLTIKGEEIPVEHRMMRVSDLRFFKDNPRIYSLVYSGEDDPSQEDIEKRLCELDHVHQLMQSIKSNGGLIDPLIVRAGDNVVLEGNSRLAAYRILCGKDPVKWGEVKCILLSKDITEDHVFALLGEYHIIGRQDWKPYEQAGYLYRRNQQHGITPERMAGEVGLKTPAIKHLIAVYQFMIDHKEQDPARWSYWDEYLKSRDIREARKAHREFDDVVVKKVKSGDIEKAIEIREKVAKIAHVKGKALKRFIEDRPLNDCHQIAVAGGADNDLYNRIHKFKQVIGNPDVCQELRNMNEQLRGKCKYELEKISKRVNELLKIVKGSGT